MDVVIGLTIALAVALAVIIPIRRYVIQNKAKTEDFRPTFGVDESQNGLVTPAAAPQNLSPQNAERGGIEDAKNYKSNFTHLESHLKNYNRPSESVRVETNIPVESGAGKGAPKSGCAQHYDQRFVIIDHNYDAAKEHTLTEREKEQLANVIVYGAILNDPAFKRKTRGRR